MPILLLHRLEDFHEGLVCANPISYTVDPH